MSEKSFDFSFAHLDGMALVMKEDEAANPLVIGLFSSVGVVLEENGITRLI